MSLALQSPPRSVRYGAALAFVFVATAFCALISWVTPITPFIVFVLATAISSSYGGMGPRLVAVLLSFLATDLFFVHPPFTLTLGSQTFVLSAYYTLGAVVSYFGVRYLRRSYLRSGDELSTSHTQRARRKGGWFSRNGRHHH